MKSHSEQYYDSFITITSFVDDVLEAMNDGEELIDLCAELETYMCFKRMKIMFTDCEIISSFLNKEITLVQPSRLFDPIVKEV